MLVAANDILAMTTEDERPPRTRPPPKDAVTHGANPLTVPLPFPVKVLMTLFTGFEVDGQQNTAKPSTKPLD